MRSRLSFLILCFSLFFAAQTLSAEVVVTYVPESSLTFEKKAFQNGSMKFMVKLGTLTFNDTDNSFFDPTLFSIDTPIQFGFTGPVTWWSDANGKVWDAEETLFQMASYCENNQTWSWLNQADFENSLASWANGSVKFNPFIVSLYLVSEQGADIYPDSTDTVTGCDTSYTLTTGTLGGFNIVVANNNSGHYSGYEYISVNGQELPEDGSAPASDTAYLVGGGTTPPPIIYPDSDEPIPDVEYLLSILDVTQFTISDAFEYGKAKVAEASLTLNNSQLDTNYGVKITFTNTLDSTYFCLHLNGQVNLYSIPYTLLFGGEEVEAGVPIDWSSLTAGDNLKEIEVTNINEARADVAPAGDYSDTIIVNITPNDTY